jgi:hypothetical protein
MALKNYKVTFEDGTETFYQFEEDDEGLKAFREAAKNKDSDVKSVAVGDPTPINTGKGAYVHRGWRRGWATPPHLRRRGVDNHAERHDRSLGRDRRRARPWRQRVG